MKLDVFLDGDPVVAVEQEILAGERAVTRTMTQAGRAIKEDWRGQVRSAGLGSRLANTVRSRTFPEGRTSLGAAALIWTKAPEIVSGFESGVTIRSKDGFFLAIPTDAAGVGLKGKRMTPLDWERRNGMGLRFVYRRSGLSLLVADDARVTKKGRAVRKRGRKRKKDGILTGAQTVPIFVLVPQARIAKRLDLMRSAERISARIPAMVAQNWK